MEQWSPIAGFPNYEISTLGRVKSLSRDYKYGKHNDIILKTNDRRGYRGVTLFKNGKRYYFAVHRLVAAAFLENPNNLPCVNHKDEDRTNNRVDNLEWCTHLYNSRYGTSREKISRGVSRSVLQYSKDGRLIKIFPSLTVAAIETGVDISSISACCKKKYRTAGGYIWRKSDE